jgi:hypothetical protein
VSILELRLSLRLWLLRPSVYLNRARHNAKRHCFSRRRYMYNETLGRWHTIDLFVGLAYLSHREAVEYPAADIAAKGTRLGLESGVNEQIKLMVRPDGVPYDDGLGQRSPCGAAQPASFPLDRRLRRPPSTPPV